MSNAQESFISHFFKLESASGVLLMFAAVLAPLCANTQLQPYYDTFLDIPIEIRIGALEVAKPLLLWINDGLMAIFFFLIGLELKRELIEGELSDKRNIILPGIGAIGGMVAPVMIYVYFNAGDSPAITGWAIPAATDIAFALGVLSLLGSRVPTSIKISLTSLAIFDDIGAIIIIAVFYTARMAVVGLVVVVCCIVILAALNRRNTESRTLYLLIGVVMWVAMLKSGVHATLAGVVLAMFIPMRSQTNRSYSPLKSLEDDLHPAVAFGALPLFAFANAGVRFSGGWAEQVRHGVPLGIALGLFLGKQVGVFGLCWVAVKVKLAKLPSGMSWTSLYGTAALCGIGFTMSLFIGSLTFEESRADLLFDERLGIIAGSLASGLVGYLILRAGLRSKESLQASSSAWG